MEATKDAGSAPLERPVRPRAWMTMGSVDGKRKLQIGDATTNPEYVAAHKEWKWEPLYEAPRWVPIATTPMPRDGGSYLVADAVRGLVAPHIRGVIHNNPGTTWDWQYGEAITHWMPMPDPPPLVGTGPNVRIDRLAACGESVSNDGLGPL